MSFFSTTETQQTAQTDGDRRRRAGGFIWLFQLLFQKRWKAARRNIQGKKKQESLGRGCCAVRETCGFKLRIRDTETSSQTKRLLNHCDKRLTSAVVSHHQVRIYFPCPRAAFKSRCAWTESLIPFPASLFQKEKPDRCENSNCS